MKANIELKNSGVIYDRENHTYSLDGRALTGITGTLVNRAYPKDELYAGVADSVLETAAARGTACHQALEDLFGVGLVTSGYEKVSSEGARLLEEKGLLPVRFEYVVTDYERYASPIDIVCLNKDGEVCIVDQKYTSKLHTESVALQTSIYARFLSIVNPGMEAKHLYVLWIHTNDSLDVLESSLLELPFAKNELIDGLMDADRNGTVFDVADYYGDFPSRVSQAEDYMAWLQTMIKERTEEFNRIKDGLCSMMTELGIKSYSSRRLQMTVVTPKPRESFDTARFKAENPELYREYIKTADTKPSVRITIKEQ